jgi:hypothetical protein
VDGTTVEENSRKISYDGWKTSASTGATGETYGQGLSQTSGARCGLFSGSTQIGLITPRPRRGSATVRALDTSANNSVAQEVTVDLQAPSVEWQHTVPVTELPSNKTHILEIVSPTARRWSSTAA